jgi:hypothetical protein
MAVVNAQTKQVGSAPIAPNDPISAGSASARAVANIGISTGTRATINGTLAYVHTSYVFGGYTRLIFGVNNGTQTIQILARADALTTTDFDNLNSKAIGAAITVVADTSTTPYTALSIQ